MTKKIIDADALLEQIKIEINDCPFSDANSKRGWGVALMNIEQHISVLATSKSQESIFDLDGWCWDMDKALKKGCHLLLKHYNLNSFFIMYDCYKNKNEDYWRSYSLLNNYELWNGFKTDNIINNNVLKNVSLDEYEEVAWRPLPKLPNTDADTDLN